VYAELKCKSNFSFLRGASDSRDYVGRALELGLPAIGITDVNGVYGIPRAYEAVKAHGGVKLITGAELKLEGSPPLTLLARTRAAYGTLCRLISAAHAGKDKGDAVLTLPELISIVGAFPGGRELIALPDLTPETNYELFREIFPGRTYVPLARYLDGLDHERTALARGLGLPILATNDPHYHAPERRPLQDCLTCVREGVTLATAGFHLFGNAERYLKSPLQMQALFQDMPEALRTTLEVAESCTFSLQELRYTYPKEFVPPGHTSQSYLEECVRQGAIETYRGVIPDAVDRQLRHELKLIAKLDYPDYFLTIFDIVRHAREIGIICQGRGSAANSLVCYVLHITSVDPVSAGLLFERFLSEERAEPPDIDVDFEHERREEVIQYIYKRYGRDRAAMVSAVRTYRERSAFLEVSKAVGVEVGTLSADALALEFAQRAGPELAGKREVVEALVEELAGFPRHLSIHSGGFVLSDGPMIELVPIEPARMENRTIVQFDKNDLETLDMMKIDVLALGFLTCLSKVSKLTGLDWRGIPGADRATYAMIQRADTEGTFQIESRAQRSMLVRSLPENFYDLVVQVSLVRPGPGVGGMVQPYLTRRLGARRGVLYDIPDPIVRSILGRTYGIPIFQEQVMRLAIERAGFSAGEADQLRRSLGGWRSTEAVSSIGQKLHDGLVAQGVSKEYAAELFGYFRGFSAYNFPESHGASFASIAYKSAYYKCHFPAEFLCATINCDPFGFYSLSTLIEAFQRDGVVLHPIDPFRSGWNASMQPDRSILMGFRRVKGIREAHVAAMEAERERKTWRDLKDFIARNSFSEQVIRGLALADAFRAFGLDQRHTYWQSLDFSSLFRGEPSQGNLFADIACEANAERTFTPMTLTEAISSEYHNLSYSLRGNIMAGVRIDIPELPATRASGVRVMKHGQRVAFAGVMSVLQRPPTAKGVAFITLEDETGTVDVVLRKEIFEANEQIIRDDRFLLVEGRVQRNGTGASVLGERFRRFGESRTKNPNVAGKHPRSLKAGEWG
jgi:error-prone DNA polymerase